MSHYGTWIEPALLTEWTELMQSYEGNAKLLMTNTWSCFAG
jgi:hypothetical protein